LQVGFRPAAHDIKDGILGRIRFDQNGDVTEGDTTVYRVEGQELVVDRVISSGPLDEARPAPEGTRVTPIY
jgi:hypothetical protein